MQNLAFWRFVRLLRLIEAPESFNRLLTDPLGYSCAAPCYDSALSVRRAIGRMCRRRRLSQAGAGGVAEWSIAPVLKTAALPREALPHKELGGSSPQLAETISATRTVGTEFGDVPERFNGSVLKTDDGESHP